MTCTHLISAYVQTCYGFYYCLSSVRDTQAVFARRKAVMRVTKKPLFRFESSRHAISVISYMREQRDIELAKGEEGAGTSNRHFEEEQPSLSQHLVCKPHYHNITGGSLWC